MRLESPRISGTLKTDYNHQPIPGRNIKPLRWYVQDAVDLDVCAGASVRGKVRLRKK